MKYVTPSAQETAFNCPHCGALTTQHWHSLRAVKNKPDDPKPLVLHENDTRFDSLTKHSDQEIRNNFINWTNKLKSGEPFLDGLQNFNGNSYELNNVFISACYNCQKLSVWIYDRLIYPQSNQDAPPANEDMPSEIKRDYIEASTILKASPRGAAALIRLAIQKLCKELGQPGKNINDDIGELVKVGLSPRVQQALDAVRVIGNSAVHPGHLDLRDDRATAETLFKLINIIVEKTISEPKHVQEVYDSLPTSARQAIEKRDS